MSLVVNLCLPPPSSTVWPGMKNAFRSFPARALSSAESGARLVPFTVTSYSNPLPPPPGVGSLPLNSTRGRLEFRWKWLRFSLELPWPSAHSAMQGLIYGIRWAVAATGFGQSGPGEHNSEAQAAPRRESREWPMAQLPKPVACPQRNSNLPLVLLRKLLPCNMSVRRWSNLWEYVFLQVLVAVRFLPQLGLRRLGGCLDRSARCLSVGQRKDAQRRHFLQ